MTERGEVDVDADALNEQIARAKELIKFLNEISSGVRKGEVDPDLLTHLATTEEERGKTGKAFDKSKTEDKELGVKSRDVEDKGEQRDEDRKPKEEIHESKDKPEIVDSSPIRAGDLTADKVRKLIESGKIVVSPEYRRLIERYFGALSEK